MKASEIMIADVITLSPDMPVREVAALMAGKGISGAPVIDANRRVLGVVSKRDLVAKVARPHLPAHIELLGGVIYLENPLEMRDEIKKMLGLTAGDIMTRKVVSVDEDTEIEEIARLMCEKKINRVPVLRDGVLVGLITRDDIIRQYWQIPESDQPPAGAPPQGAAALLAVGRRPPEDDGEGNSSEADRK